MLQTTKNDKKSLLSNKCRGMDFKKAKIVACKAKPNYHVWIRFEDGLEGEVDLSHLVGQGIFSVLGSLLNILMKCASMPEHIRWPGAMILI